MGVNGCQTNWLSHSRSVADEVLIAAAILFFRMGGTGGLSASVAFIAS